MLAKLRPTALPPSGGLRTTKRPASRMALALACLLTTVLAPDSRAAELGEPDPASALAMTQAIATTESVPGGGTLDLLSGGLEIAVPLYGARLSDRLAYALSARHSSKDMWRVAAWYQAPVPTYPDGWMFETWGPDDLRDNARFADGACAGDPDERPDHGWSTELGWGWRFSLGRIAQFGGRHVIMPDGSVHKLYQLGRSGVAPTDGGEKELITRDGSRLRVTWFYNVPEVRGDNRRYRNRIYKVFAPDGVIYEYGHYVSAPGDCGDDDNQVDDFQRNGWYLTSMADQFGNRIDVKYHEEKFREHIISAITDTHGRLITTTLTDNADPVLDGLIESITYPTVSGTATVGFRYYPEPVAIQVPGWQSEQRTCSDTRWRQVRPMRVALLQFIKLPEGVTHEFEYANGHGEVTTHVLPTGGRATYTYDNYTWTNETPDAVIPGCAGGPGYYPPDAEHRAATQGRGVVVRSVEAAPGDVATWVYYRNQRYPVSPTATALAATVCNPQGGGASVCYTDFHVNVKDPVGMWRSLTFLLPQWLDTASLCSNVTLPVTPLLHHAYVWDRPIPTWPDMDRGARPPSPTLATLHLENKWEIDGWNLTASSGQELIDQNARVSWSGLTIGGALESTSRCGWDGFGHFEDEILRNSLFSDFGQQITKRTYSPLVCQWILDLPIREQVANIPNGATTGFAATVERRFTPDGQVAREIRRSAFDPFTAPTCDNANDPVVKEGPGRSVEAALKDHTNNWIDQVSFVGPWLLLEHHAGADDGYLWCDSEWVDFHVRDPALFGQPAADPGPAASCNPDPEFQPPTTPIEKRTGSGDVQTDYFYFGSRSESANADGHGHAAWGQLRRTELTGGDPIDLNGDTVPDPPAASFVKHFTWACGTPETERWDAFTWLVRDQDVQCDGCRSRNANRISWLV